MTLAPRGHFRGIRGVLVISTPVLVLAILAAGARAAEWVDVTGNVGGAKWGAYGVHYLSAVPGTSAVIAGVSEAGLWKSADEGATWTKLGGSEIRSRPDRIVYDPRNPDIFWVSGCYGDAPFRTDDGGKTFQRLGRLSAYPKTVCGGRSSFQERAASPLPFASVASQAGRGPG